MSLVFNPYTENLPKTKSEAFSINYTKGQYIDILEKLDQEEEKLIISDLMGLQPIYGNIQIIKCDISEAKQKSGKKVTKIINSYECQL